MNVEAIIYGVIPVWLMGVMCILITVINIWQSRTENHPKRWQKRIKAVNWLILGCVYIYLYIVNPDPADVRAFIRAALFMLILGEFAYHTDTTIAIISTINDRLRRRRNG